MARLVGALCAYLEEVVLCGGGDAGHDACVAGGGGLGLQVVGEDGLSLVEEDGSEARERDPGVVSNAEDLALVRGELVGGLVVGSEVEDTDQVHDCNVDLGARPNSLPAFPPFCSLASLPLGEE